MARVSIAVEELDRLLRPVHEGVVDGLAHHHPAHRHRAGRHPLGEGDHVGLNAIALGGERRAETAEPGDDLVEDEQDAVLVADLAQPLQIALRRRQNTPVEPAIGSTITAAMVDASCSATILSSASARWAPQSGSPLVKA